jgi:hypothetical protein
VKIVRRSFVGRFVPMLACSIAFIGGTRLAVPVLISTAEGAVSVPSGRFEFASVPEQVFVAGIAETVQLGIRQLDPLNRWPAGDQTRESGWISRYQTRLVDVTTGTDVTGFDYDGSTGELRYSGNFAGDVTVRLERADAAVKSNEFRIRVLLPTFVYGDNAAAITASRGWPARVCQTPMLFVDCRKTFTGGATDAAPLVIFFTPGSYTGDFWIGGRRRFVYVLGDPTNWPTLTNDSIDVSKFELAQIRNFRLRSTRIVNGGNRNDSPTTLLLSNIDQCCEAKNNFNGIVNPDGFTPFRWTIHIWNFTSSEMGSPWNTFHAMYLEGRPNSYLEIDNIRILGTRASSGIKTTMQNVAIRHSLFSVSDTPYDPSTGLLMHTPIDVPAPCRLVVYGNEFLLYRASTVTNPVTREGILAGAIFLRLRQMGMMGSDIPAYPNITWTPPATTQTTMSSPGAGWAAGPETFVKDAFWSAVRAKPVTDPAHVLTFKHYIGFNRFVQLPGSLPVTAVRDDGTHPMEPVYQFGPSRALRTHPLWLERSVTFLAGNEYDGYAAGARLYDLDSSQYVKEIEPGAKWPRTKDEEFPHAVELSGTLPTWFGL